VGFDDPISRPSLLLDLSGCIEPSRDRSARSFFFGEKTGIDSAAFELFYGHLKWIGIVILSNETLDVSFCCGFASAQCVRHNMFTVIFRNGYSKLRPIGCHVVSIVLDTCAQGLVLEGCTPNVIESFALGTMSYHHGGNFNGPSLEWHEWFPRHAFGHVFSTKKQAPWAFLYLSVWLRKTDLSTSGLHSKTGHSHTRL
jgi:hypothetical protein